MLKEIKSRSHTHLYLISLVMIVLSIIIRESFSMYDRLPQIAFSIVFVWAVFVYAWLIYCCKQLTTTPINLYSLLILFSFLFYFGQHTIVFLGKSEVLLPLYRSILDGRIPSETRAFAGYYVLIILLFLNIGIIAGKSTTKRKLYRSKASSLLYDDCTRKVAWAIFLVVMIPTLFKFYTDATNMLTSGYTDSLEAAANASGLYKVCYFLSYFYFPSIYLLLISYSDSSKKNFIILAYLVSSIIYLMSGSRFRIFESVVAILLIYNYKIQVIEKRKLVVLCIAGFLLLFTFSVIREMRVHSALLANNPTAAVSDISSNIIKEGVLTGALIETGSTFEIIDNVLYHCPDKIPHSYGYSIIGAVLIALPSFLRGDFNESQVSVSKIFSPEYTSEIDIGMGSSFIAESYYNFGYFSVFFILLFGFFIGRLLQVPSRLKRAGNNFAFYRYAYLSSIICFAIRTDLVAYLRYYIYYVLFIQLLIWLLYTSKRSAYNK